MSEKDPEDKQCQHIKFPMDGFNSGLKSDIWCLVTVGSVARVYLKLFMEYFVSGFWAFSGDLSELGELGWKLSKDRGIWSSVIAIFYISTHYNMEHFSLQ